MKSIQDYENQIKDIKQSRIKLSGKRKRDRISAEIQNNNKETKIHNIENKIIKRENNKLTKELNNYNGADITKMIEKKYHTTSAKKVHEIAKQIIQNNFN